LDRDDLTAALQVLTALDDVYVIFNGGEPAGCTRVHRHMQGLLGPPRAFNLFTGDSSQKSKIPFRHFSHHFTEGFGSLAASNLLEVYLKLVDECKKAMELGPEEQCPHNVVLWKDWIIVMPRRSALAGTHGSANAAGMLGSIWVTEQSAVDEWLRWGCRNALGQMGVPP
jgi:ATP adenylyltransferase/5',5'''-P-1,P-4-tetraphosphate phosphorylase II